MKTAARMFLTLSQQVALTPEVVVVARGAVTTARKLTVPNEAIAVLPPRGIAAVDEVVEKIDVLSQPAAEDGRTRPLER